jgi:hypothetical protein
MKYKTNVTLSHFSDKHGWRGEAMSTSQCGWVSAALVIQHVMRLPHIKFSSMACLALQFFSVLPKKNARFTKINIF